MLGNKGSYLLPWYTFHITHPISGMTMWFRPQATTCHNPQGRQEGDIKTFSPGVTHDPNINVT